MFAANKAVVAKIKLNPKYYFIMKETKKNNNNQVHIFGYVNDVRMNEMESGKTAINLDVVSLEQYKDKDDKYQTRRTYHDVAIFTDDKKLIEKFSKIGADVENNRANREVEGFKPETHTISMDGILVNKSNKLGDTDKTYRTLQILGNEASIDLDVKQAENEVRNRAEIVGNIADINLHEDKKFAVVTLMHHYRPEGSEKEYETVVDVRINGDRKFSKEAYEAIVKGELGKGDFVRLGGQLHNNRFENEEGVRYGVSMDLTSYALLKKSQKQAEKAGEKVEVKEEKKAAKAASKKAAPKKEAAPKKATPRKKGVRMG